MKRSISYWDPLFIPQKRVPKNVDVVIVGAGIAGCSAALTLQKSGVSFVILERFSAIGSGISSRDIAVSRLGVGDNPFRLSSSLGNILTQQILQYTHQNAHWLIENGFNLNQGGLTIAKNEAEGEEITQSIDILRKLGWTIEEWSPEKINLELNTSGLKNGYYYPLDISYSPSRFFAHCQKLESSVVPNCIVKEVASGSNLIVRTSLGEINCEILLVACNAQSRSVDPFFEDKITPVRLQTIAVPHTGKGSLPSNCQFGYLQWRDINNHRLLSGCRWGTAHLEIGENDDSVVSKPIGGHLRNLAKQCFGFEKEPTHEWTGIMGFSCDGLPLIGQLPGASDIIACCAFSGNQGSLGFKAGQSAARLILDGEDPDLPDLFLPGRFL
jgi:glycine/D-amino acid oxidase-like deaminating enzyme